MRYTDLTDLPAPVSGSVELQFIDRIGTGGFASVYRARQVGLDRLVAVKVLHPGGEPAARRRFVEESRVLARMPPHPAIVAVHANITVADVDYVVMELVTGGTLEDRLADGPLELREAVAIASWLAAALASAHSFGIVHGDIKASNVLLTPSGHPKLADFGAAAGAEGGVPRTPGSAAPEVLRGADPSVRSDVYSFGRLLARCLGDEVRSIAALDRLVAEMTAVDPADRPAPMDDVLERLRAIEAAERWDRTPAVLLVAEDETLDPIQHGSPPTVESTGRRSETRRPKPLAVALVLVAVLVAFVIGRTWTDGTSREAPPPSVGPSTPDGDQLSALRGIGPYTVLSFMADPSLATTPGLTSAVRLDAFEAGLGSSLGRQSVAMRTSGPQALGLPERAGRVRIQAYNSDLDSWCRGIRSDELELVDSSEGGWRFAGDGGRPLLAAAWVTRMSSPAAAHAVFTMHALQAGIPGRRCEGGLRERLVDPGQIRVAPGGPTLAGLEEADEVSVIESAHGLAVAARRGTTVVGFVVVSADGGPADLPTGALGASLGAALAP